MNIYFEIDFLWFIRNELNQIASGQKEKEQMLKLVRYWASMFESALRIVIMIHFTPVGGQLLCF